MNYSLNMGNWGKVFAVPSCVVDNYIKLASGIAIKVLLYMLCNNYKDLTTEEISKATNIPLEQVDEALCFWEQVEIFNKDCNKLEVSTVIKPEIIKEVVSEDESKPVEDPKPALQMKQKSTGTLTPKEIAERIQSSQEIAFLFTATEASLKHLLTNTEHRSLIWMHDYLGLPADVILMLIEYCKTIDKTNVRYIETVAIAWQEKEILTHEAAENEIKNLKERHSLSSTVMSAFGITNRKLSSKEESFIIEWTTKNYSFELISYAYEKTIDSINKLSFPYINKILNDWHSKGLLTKEQIDKENQNHPKSFTNDKEHSYDLDKFDTLALNFTPKNK